jgi:hypothetical protein
MGTKPQTAKRLLGALGTLALIGCGGGSDPQTAENAPPPASTAVVGMGPFIVVDQFGYLPDGEKIAVVRDPQTGFDAADAFAPGASYEVIDTATNAAVMTGTATPWNAGAMDASSGDRVWHFDFSSVTAPGTYEILDVDRNVRSARFEIRDDIYRSVLTQAMRVYFYQRVGFPKTAQFAGPAWADAASHMGPLQDPQARLYSARDDASTERDLRGGWYDAGDYSKYTARAARDVVTLLRAYAERPRAFTDDYGIPESGNGVPDILDEVKWELDWLVRMQNGDGSVLSIVGEDSGSPPSSATGQSLYGSASAHATLSTAAVYALGAKVYGAQVPALAAYAADLQARAVAAWTWGIANPDVQFRNNDPSAGTSGLGSGQQETDDYGRAMDRIVAAIYLFDLTGDATYREYVDAHYREAHLFTVPLASASEAWIQRPLLYYASLSGATPAVAADIRNQYVAQFDRGNGWGAVSTQADPYMAYLAAYSWGSNGMKAAQGAMFIDLVLYGLSSHPAAASTQAASHYVHYLHGVNPLGKVYLSNMSEFGAENSVAQFFHHWFGAGTQFDKRVNPNAGPPPPGYLVGGANSQYSWEQGCPLITPLCGVAPPSPPFDQPAQKSYLDFNASYPIDSWTVTEPDLEYQANYILLLSKFVR